MCVIIFQKFQHAKNSHRESSFGVILFVYILWRGVPK